jgi:hypothetical protein
MRKTTAHKAQPVMMGEFRAICNFKFEMEKSERVTSRSERLKPAGSTHSAGERRCVVPKKRQA